MFYCYNCKEFFRFPLMGSESYPDFGGEPVSLCPHCGIPEMYEEVKDVTKENH